MVCIYVFDIMCVWVLLCAAYVPMFIQIFCNTPHMLLSRSNKTKDAAQVRSIDEYHKCSLLCV